MSRIDAVRNYKLHANHVLAYSILNTAETALLTRLLGVYLASWYSPAGADTTAVTVHPEDDRTRLALGGISQHALEAIRAGIQGADSMWRMVPSSLTETGVAYHLQADVRRDLVIPASWAQDKHAWDPDRRVGMKWAARYAVSLTHEDRMALLVLSTGLTAHSRKGAEPVEYSRADLERLLPDCAYYSSIERLEQRGYIEVRWGKDTVAVRWTPRFSDHLLTYKEAWWGSGGTSRGWDAETDYERAWRDEHGLSLDPHDDADADESRPWSVYVLVDPRTGKGRYVGITRDPRVRLRQHVEREGTGTGDGGYGSGSHDVNPGMRAWIANLQAEGLEPRQEIIGSVAGDRAAAEAAEAIAILAAHLCGDVLNIDVVRQWEKAQSARRHGALLAG